MNEEKIRKAIKHYKFVASPSNGNGSAPATVKDINNLIEKTSELIVAVVEAMKEEWLSAAVLVYGGLLLVIIRNHGQNTKFLKFPITFINCFLRFCHPNV